MATLNEDLSVTGRVAASSGFSGPVDRSNLVQEDSQVFEIPLQGFRVHDAFQTNLPSVGANDDIGLTAGTYGTQIPYLKSQDLNGLGAMTQEKARTKFTLPNNYVEFSTVKIRVYAGMLTSVASVSATVDLQAFLCGRATAGPIVSGSDLCVTSAISANSTTMAACEFTLTSSALSPGSVLDLLLLFDANSATASSHFLIATHVEAILSVKG